MHRHRIRHHDLDDILYDVDHIHNNHHFARRPVPRVRRLHRQLLVRD